MFKNIRPSTLSRLNVNTKELIDILKFIIITQFFALVT